MMENATVTTLRLLARVDVPALVTIDADAFQAEAWDSAAFDNALSHIQCQGYGLWQGATMTGYFLYEICADHVDVWSIAVHHSSQGQGLGKLLMYKVFADTLALGKRKVRLLVHQHNTRARRFYDRLGFHKCGRIRLGYYPGGGAAVPMHRILLRTDQEKFTNATVDALMAQSNRRPAQREI